jgi:tetratricopeptide (TPR) repeat protein
VSALEEDRDFLLRSLDDLEREREAGDLEESDYLALKEDYTARAAAVLRALAAEPEADPAAAPAPVAVGATPGAAVGDGDGAAAGATPDGPQARRRLTERAPAGPGRGRWRPVVVGAALLAFASAAGLLVARSAGERLPGDAATGEIASTGPSSEIADELAGARDLIGEGRTLDAIKAYDRILERDPEQPEALAYRGWLLRLAGKAADDTSLIDKGMEFIERAVAADPGYPDARFFRAFVNYQDRRDPAAAVPDLRAYLAGESPPEMRPVVEDLLRRALADAERGVTSPEPVPAPPTTAPG